VAEDLYAVLGIERTASQAEIRAAYRRLAQTRHPDRPSGSEAAMVALNLAYRVLGDPERRRRYDASLGPASPLPAAQGVEQGDLGHPASPLWTDEDLDAHADDLRQMFEEERNLWEQLLAVHPEGSVEAALAQTRHAQLELENAIRARFDLGPPLSAEQFEVQRAAELARTPSPPSGCLTLLLLWVIAPTRLSHPACAWRRRTRAPRLRS
jgi:curved DNA-binding protein CbpA